MDVTATDATGFDIDQHLTRRWHGVRETDVEIEFRRSGENESFHGSGSMKSGSPLARAEGSFSQKFSSIGAPS
jgi:hypothetical protein